jgi:CheY-like chemotaxis protein
VRDSFPTLDFEDIPTLPEHPPYWRVLLADDEPAMIDLVGGLLVSDGHLVTCVRTGEEVLHAFRAHDEIERAEPFDLVVTDHRMPQKGGLDAAYELRSSGISTPIVVMTAFPDDALRRRADALEVTLLAKPFRLAVLRFTLDLVVGLRARA